MSLTYWHKQGDEPLYKELLWDKPENKLHAGKLLIIGGNLHRFSTPALAYQTALNSGVGICKVLLPLSLNKIVGNHIADAEFVPSNKSGSFNSQSFAEWLDFSKWADGVLLAGDFSNNSETAIVLEKFISKHDGQVTIVGDTIDIYLQNIDKIAGRPKTTLVLDFSQLQKLGKSLKLPFAFTSNLPLATMVENLYSLNSAFPLNLVLLQDNIYFVVSDGEVSTTKANQNKPTQLIEIATKISVWCLQNPSKIFEALCCATYELSTK